MENSKMLLAKYHALVKRIDKRVASLEQLHHQHLQCRLGCSQCCMDYSIFPIEFHAIQDKIRNLEIEPVEAKEDDCIFLHQHACLIYEHRPIICRTHGLPLLYTNEDGEWELSACELNFTNYEKPFHSRNSLQQDRYNSELYMLNKAFIELPENSSYAANTLIPLRKLR